MSIKQRGIFLGLSLIVVLWVLALTALAKVQSEVLVCTEESNSAIR